MSRRRKEKKRKEKRLERIPEKLQRKRERRERYRARRTPQWVRYGLVVTVLIVIIVGAWFLVPRPDPIPPPDPLGGVYVLQEDNFHIYINETGHVNIDFMLGRYGAGTFEGETPLNLSMVRNFEESQVNFTFPDSSVFYDYYGSAYNIVAEVGSEGYNYTVNNIVPAFLFNDTQTKLIGHEDMLGYWSLFWEYFLNSSQNLFLAQDEMSSLFTFTFSFSMENDTLIYNTPTTVHCNVSFHNPPDGTNVYDYGKIKLLFPKQVYNESTLLANISLIDVQRLGSRTNFTLPDSAVINNATHIGFDEPAFDVSMSQNQTYGYIFDLNVTAFTNSSFAFLDLTTPENEYYLQSGETVRVDGQPMYFPEAEISINTPYFSHRTLNVTNLFFAFPQVWVTVSPAENSTPNPSPAIFLYMPKTLSRQHASQNPYFGAEETIGSNRYPLVSPDTKPVGTLFHMPLKNFRIRRLPWV